jgi:hypothetical protein
MAEDNANIIYPFLPSFLSSFCPGTVPLLSDNLFPRKKKEVRNKSFSFPLSFPISCPQEVKWKEEGDWTADGKAKQCPWSKEREKGERK